MPVSEQPNTAEIRYRLERGGATYIGKDTLALCDALDAARAERDEARRTRDDQYDRAEAAEANLAHVRSLNITAAAGSWNDAWAAMRDDRDNWCDCAVHWRGARDRCKARIEAVRAVLAAHGPDGMNSAGYDLWSDVNHALLP